MNPASTFPLELTRPALLGLLLLVPFLVYYFSRSLVDFPWRQRLASLIVRSTILVLLILSLAGLTLYHSTDRQFVIFALDESTSVGEASAKKIESFIEKAKEGQGEHEMKFLRFARQPDMVRDDYVPEAELDRQGTSIASAIDVAVAAIPPSYVPKIVLFSDGNETTGQAHRSASAARVPILTVPLAVRDENEVQVSRIVVPTQVSHGEPFYVEVVIDSNHDDEGMIEVYRGDHQVISERKPIKKGENKFRFQQTIERERLAEYSVRIREMKDTLADNNKDSGLVFASGKPRILMVCDDPKQVSTFSWELEQGGLKVDVRPAKGMPDRLSDIQNYELVILSNVPADQLTLRQMEIARTYVQDLGGGFVMLGGDQSFGLGGYYRSVIEEILPVRSDFEKEKEKPSLAMVLVIDKSGSMGGDKIELAKEAAKNAVELLGTNDQIGVVAFDGESYWICDMHPCRDKGYILERIASIEAGGGTDMHPAMEEAFAALQGAAAKLKHVIILTDGISAPGDFEGLASEMASNRMTLSTVAVGEGADEELLEELAKIGRGRYYLSTDPSSVPQIFAKETVIASKSALNEEPFLAQVIRPSPPLASIDIESAPFLLGYVVTRPKATSEVILSSERGDPLLSWWRYGLGMTVAFTSDTRARWAAEWISWPEFGRFWTQILRHAMRKGDAKGLQVQVDESDGTTKVTIDAADPTGQYVNDALTKLTVIDPQMKRQQPHVQQTAPGRYVAEFPSSLSGAYHLELSQSAGGKEIFQQSRGLVIGYPEELRLRPTNETLLRQLAEETGGIYEPDPKDVFAATTPSAPEAKELWPILVSFAVVLLVIDVALRRIDFSLWSLRRLAWR